MGYDRQFFTDTKAGFSPCKQACSEGGKYIYHCFFTLPSDGFYYLQYTLDRDTEGVYVVGGSDGKSTKTMIANVSGETVHSRSRELTFSGRDGALLITKDASLGLLL